MAPAPQPGGGGTGGGGPSEVPDRTQGDAPGGVPGDVPLPPRLLAALDGDPSSPAGGWLADLPGLLRRQLADWDLTLERVPHPGGRSSLVALVRQADGVPATLKLPAPRPAADRRPEAAALAHWKGLGAARLLRSDPATGALLVERLRGEVSLRSLPQAKALLEAAGTLRRLWVAPPREHPFESVGDRTARQVETALALTAADRAADVRPLVDEATAVRDDLLAGPPERVLLHGGFRQGKVLAGERMPWLGVGPTPLVGEHAYDLARLALDRYEDLAAGSSPAAQVRRRIAGLADSLEVDRDRLRGWTLYRAVVAGLRRSAAGDRRHGELLLEFASWL